MSYYSHHPEEWDAIEVQAVRRWFTERTPDEWTTERLDNMKVELPALWTYIVYGSMPDHYLTDAERDHQGDLVDAAMMARDR